MSLLIKDQAMQYEIYGASALAFIKYHGTLEELVEDLSRGLLTEGVSVEPREPPPL